MIWSGDWNDQSMRITVFLKSIFRTRVTNFFKKIYTGARCVWNVENEILFNLIFKIILNWIIIFLRQLFSRVPSTCSPKIVIELLKLGFVMKRICFIARTKETWKPHRCNNVHGFKKCLFTTEKKPTGLYINCLKKRNISIFHMNRCWLSPIRVKRNDRVFRVFLFIVKFSLSLTRTPFRKHGFYSKATKFDVIILFNIIWILLAL